MPLLILAVLTVVGAYVIYRDAEARGMNARLWTLVMLLTSMLALPVYLVARKPKVKA